MTAALTFFDNYGGYRVFGRDLPGGSREFQVRAGRRVLARFDYLSEALEDADGRNAYGERTER